MIQSSVWPGRRHACQLRLRQRPRLKPSTMHHTPTTANIWSRVTFMPWFPSCSGMRRRAVLGSNQLVATCTHPSRRNQRKGEEDLSIAERNFPDFAFRDGTMEVGSRPIPFATHARNGVRRRTIQPAPHPCVVSNHSRLVPRVRM
jgi:hypothetical protein